MAWLFAAIIGMIVALIISGSVARDRRIHVILSLILGAVGGILGVWLFFAVLGLFTTSANINLALGVLWSAVGSALVMGIVYWIASLSYNREYPEERAFREGTAHEYDEEERITRKRRK